MKLEINMSEEGSKMRDTLSKWETQMKTGMKTMMGMGLLKDYGKVPELDYNRKSMANEKKLDYNWKSMEVEEKMNTMRKVKEDELVVKKGTKCNNEYSKSLIELVDGFLKDLMEEDKLDQMDIMTETKEECMGDDMDTKMDIK